MDQGSFEDDEEAWKALRAIIDHHNFLKIATRKEKGLSRKAIDNYLESYAKLPVHIDVHSINYNLSNVDFKVNSEELIKKLTLISLKFNSMCCAQLS